MEVKIETYETWDKDPKPGVEICETRDLKPPKGNFTCFSCQRIRSPWYWAKNLMGRRICKLCAPYIAESDIGLMISFDRGKR